MEERLEDKQQLVLDLQKKAKVLIVLITKQAFLGFYGVPLSAYHQAVRIL